MYFSVVCNDLFTLNKTHHGNSICLNCGLLLSIVLCFYLPLVLKNISAKCTVVGSTGTSTGRKYSKSNILNTVQRVLYSTVQVRVVGLAVIKALHRKKGFSSYVPLIYYPRNGFFSEAPDNHQIWTANSSCKSIR